MAGGGITVMQHQECQRPRRGSEHWRILVKFFSLSFSDQRFVPEEGPEQDQRSAPADGGGSEDR